MISKEKVNFDKLAKLAYGSDKPIENNMQNLNQLWQATFDLREWIFLTAENPQFSQDPFPLVSNFEGRNWLLVFTDSQKMQSYAQKHNLTDENNNSYFMSIPTAEALQWIQKFEPKDIYGVRFNQGSEGWFSPIPQIKEIFDFLY